MKILFIVTVLFCGPFSHANVDYNLRFITKYTEYSAESHVAISNIEMSVWDKDSYQNQSERLARILTDLLTGARKAVRVCAKAQADSELALACQTNQSLFADDTAYVESYAHDFPMEFSSAEFLKDTVTSGGKIGAGIMKIPAGIVTIATTLVGSAGLCWLTSIESMPLYCKILYAPGTGIEGLGYVIGGAGGAVVGAIGVLPVYLTVNYDDNGRVLKVCFQEGNIESNLNW